MAEMKTIRFPGSSEVYEIVDAAARNDIAGLKARMNGLVDDTLSEAGSAADAKATGDAIAQAKQVAEDAAEVAETSANTLRQLLPTTSGTGVRVTLEDDTIAAPLAGLVIYGKSVQASTPSRTSPADIVTAGYGGGIAILTEDGSGNVKSGADIYPSGGAGLPGIAVPASGTWNHRGEDGRCWLCDVIDFDSGTYIRRVGMTTFRDLLRVTYSSATGIFKTTSPIPTSLFTNYIITRIYESVDNDSSVPPTLQDGQICPINAGPHVQWKDSRFNSVEDLMAAIGDEPILYKLRANSSIKLTDQQLAAFRSLMSAAGTTVVYADDPAEPELSVKACVNLISWIDRRIAGEN